MAKNNATSASPSGTASTNNDAVRQHHRLAEGQKVNTGCGTGKQPPK